MGNECLADILKLSLAEIKIQCPLHMSTWTERNICLEESKAGQKLYNFNL